MESFISPKYTNKTFGNTPTIDEKILVFENREVGWRIAHAKALNEVPHAGYAIVSILFSYFEMISQYISGETSKNNPKEFFRRGYREVYPDSALTDDDIDLVYKKVRCGMYHSGMTKINTLLSGEYKEGISVKSDFVLVNPHKLINDIDNHLKNYVSLLRDGKQIRKKENFTKVFDNGLAE